MVGSLTDFVIFKLTYISAEPLTEEEIIKKDEYVEQGFPDWSRRDFQQFVRALESHGWSVFGLCFDAV
jgi:hypothetical protein